MSSRTMYMVSHRHGARGWVLDFTYCEKTAQEIAKGYRQGGYPVREWIATPFESKRMEQFYPGLDIPAWIEPVHSR